MILANDCLHTSFDVIVENNKTGTSPFLEKLNGACDNKCQELKAEAIVQFQNSIDDASAMIAKEIANLNSNGQFFDSLLGPAAAIDAKFIKDVKTAVEMEDKNWDIFSITNVKEKMVTTLQEWFDIPLTKTQKDALKKLISTWVLDETTWHWQITPLTTKEKVQALKQNG